VNVEKDVAWSLILGSDHDPIGTALRRAIRLQSDDAPAELTNLLERIDPRPTNRRKDCQEN
jgi:hypothetical protein